MYYKERRDEASMGEVALTALMFICAFGILVFVIAGAFPDESSEVQNEIVMEEIEYKLEEIIDSGDNYVVIFSDNKAEFFSKDTVTFEISDTEKVIVDEEGIVTFYVTKERMVELAKMQ